MCDAKPCHKARSVSSLYESRMLPQLSEICEYHSSLSELCTGVSAPKVDTPEVDVSVPSVDAPAVDAPAVDASLPGAPDVSLDADKPKKKSSLFVSLLGRKKDKKDAGAPGQRQWFPYRYRTYEYSGLSIFWVSLREK